MAAQYWTYQPMMAALMAWQRAFASLMEVEVIGQSREGRDLVAVVMTNRATGEPLSKAALFVDANIHAGEVAGNAAAMSWIEWCLKQYGTNPEATYLLDHYTVYVVPRIAVDGAERYLTTPYRVRSSPHEYPFTEPPDGFVEEDVNGDGHILLMRVPAEDGGFAVDDLDPRVMRRRYPGEVGGTYYHVFPEGRLRRRARHGALPPWSDAERARSQAMDFNRNFPVRWAGEHGQPGAGPYPLSEPEVQHLARYIAAHPNIAAYVALHTAGGVILRQPSTGEDTVLSLADRGLFTRVAEMGALVSGYAADSNYHVFATGHETVLMPGAADDWMYDHLGVLSFTLEMWNLPARAGARGYGREGVKRMMARSIEEEAEDQRKIFRWVEAEVPAEGVFPWTPFDHPDFGPVDIGGLNPKFVVQNPPPHLLEEECAHVAAFLTRLALCAPRLVITQSTVTAEGPNLYRVVVEVANAGFLPTSSTEKGKDLLLEGLTASIHGPVEVVAGRSPLKLGHLEGYGTQETGGPHARQRAVAEWVVRKSAPGTVEIRVGGPRAGYVTRTLNVGEG
ncbi:MAG: M14 family metallopeptidase [Firmicutes bacterium]|nr:M14 family metallopeptidase [Bacillota bacterium]